VSDARVSTGMRAQLRSRRHALDHGADHVGWKIGLNPPAVLEQLGLDEPVIGHLTSATELGDGDSYTISGGTNVAVEPELALEVGRDGAIVRIAPALEVVDLDTPLDQLATVIGENVFHRGVAFGEWGEPEPPERARLLVDGEVVAEPELPDGEALAATVGTVARRLEEAGERLSEGDRIIAGSLVRALPARPGKRIRLELDPHGAVELGIHA
jgi:2-oxo-3-hexenedioate decarboxylase